tara:strand:+ start:3897 stop:5165 length:1269 start_codon:yes stop_codon:yes gene_type:complete
MKKIKIIHINHTNNIGGAGIAVARLNDALIKQGINSEIWSNFSKNKSGFVPKKKPIEKIYELIVRVLNKSICFIFFIKAKSLISTQYFGSHFWVKRINNSDADLIHLHWTQHNMLSISDISKIKKPIVWTNHDMWVFCGVEHVDYSEYWQNGYNFENRLNDLNMLFFLNKVIWNKKKREWKKKINMIAPSSWMSECLKKSILTQNWPIHQIYNAIDINFWYPIDKNVLRKKYNISKEKIVLLFNMPRTKDYHKGYDLLLKSFEYLSNVINKRNILVVYYGFELSNSDNLKNLFDFKSFGKVNDHILLRDIYNLADIYLSSSRIDNLSNCVLEACACGLPIIAYNVCGFKNLVRNNFNGYLVSPFDTRDFANKISLMIKEIGKNDFKKNSRNMVLEKFRSEIISKKHLYVYNTILSETNNQIL